MYNSNMWLFSTLFDTLKKIWPQTQFNPSLFQPTDIDGSVYNIVFRLYYLDEYVISDLDSSFTDKVKADLEIVKQQGWTVLLRFAYTKETSKVKKVGRDIKKLHKSTIAQPILHKH